jgi:pilus assembly protein CpaB
VAALAYRYLRDQQAQIELARRAATGATIDLVVANDTIPVGARIDADKVRMVHWPVDLEPNGTIHNLDDVVGSVARTSIEKNQPLLQSAIVPKGAGLLPLLIADGMRGMSVKVDSVTGVSGFITPNSRVDVLVSGSPQASGESEQRSKMVLQNIRVLATGTSIEQADEKPVEVPTVTLMVSPEEAERLTLAARQEPVRLALRNYRDEDPVATPGIGTRTLFAADEGTTSKGKPRAVGSSVQILLGDKMTRQPLF